MSVFDKKDEKTEIVEKDERILTEELLDKQMDNLEKEARRLEKINKDNDLATTESKMLAFNNNEVRNSIILLREKLSLIDYWRAKIK